MESVSGSLRIPTLEEATKLERIANATARYAVQVRAWAVEDNTPDSLHTYKEAKLQAHRCQGPRRQSLVLVLVSGPRQRGVKGPGGRYQNVINYFYPLRRVGLLFGVV